MFVSGGSLVLKRPDSVMWSGTTQTLSSVALSGYWAAYSAIYEQQLWVYTVVNKRASLLANLPLKVYARGENNSRDDRSDSALAALLRNPVPGLSSIEWWMWVASTEDIYGEAFVWKRRDRGGRPFQLPPLHPTCMSRNGDDDGWVYDNGRTRLDLPDSDVMHFRRYSPSSSRRGLSPLEPLRRTLENEDASRRATSAFWRNGARPAFALKHPRTVSGPAQERLKAQFDQRFSGPDNTGNTIFFEEGMEAQVLSLSASDAQYIDSRKLNREEVCGAYDMAPPAVHILDNATYSNITEQFRSVYRDTIGPWAHRLESVIAVQLVPEFDPEGVLYVEFLMDEVLRGDFETRQQALRTAEHYTLAEKRRVENLPYIPGTDVLMLHSAYRPLDSLIAEGEAAAGAPPDDLPDNVIPMPVARSVVGRLSWQKTLDQVDPDVLTAGLNGSTQKVLAAFAAAKDEGLTVADFRDRVMSMVKE